MKYVGKYDTHMVIIAWYAFQTTMFLSFLWDHWYPCFALLVVNIWPEFQIQGWSIARFLFHLPAIDSSDAPLVWHLLASWWSTWQLKFFDQCTCKHLYNHWWGSDPQSTCLSTTHLTIRSFRLGSNYPCFDINNGERMCMKNRSFIL